MTTPHNPDCDVNDVNPDGIKKPCNCEASAGQLPYAPEPIAQLRARFDRALDRLWDVTDWGEPTKPPPGRPFLAREHVFDLEDGCRFIITREINRTHSAAEYVHVSFWARTDCELIGKPITLVLAGIVRRLGEISGRRWGPRVSVRPISDAIHFLFPLPAPAPAPDTEAFGA